MSVQQHSGDDSSNDIQTPTDGRVDFEYTSERGSERIHRTWIKMGDTVKEIDNEQYYSYTDEEWKQSYRFTREYDIDDGGYLIGDGSNWDGDGRLWYEHAHIRHEKRIRLRFPYDF